MFRYLSAAVFLLISSFLHAQINTPEWPAPRGYLNYSNVYTVKVKQGNRGFQEVTTLMTRSQDELTRGGPFTNRTFNFAPFSFNPNGGPVTIRVEKNAGIIGGNVNSAVTNVEIINPVSNKKKIDNNTVEFILDSPRYVSVNFKLNNNINRDSRSELVKHMLMIFADPINDDLVEPNGLNKVVYSPNVSEQQLRNADIIVFRKGYHNLKNRFNLRGMGVTKNTKIWLAPDAVVSGFFVGVDQGGNSVKREAPNVEIYGRGLLYMGDFRNSPNNPNSGPYRRPDVKSHNSGERFKSTIHFPGSANIVVRGIMIGDILHHGIASGSFATIDRIKIWGWHPNNDGARPGYGSEVKNSFFRAVDDALYAYELHVENNIFWQSYNGAIVTTGWNGIINTGGIVLENNTVLYPEWLSPGNNNGIVASQLGDDQECTSVTINNMTIYGDTGAFLNLKPSSRRDQRHDPNSGVREAGVRNVSISNLTIKGNLKNPSVLQSDSKFTVRNITLHNIKIEGFSNRYLTNADRSNRQLFFGNNLTNNTRLKITSSANAPRSVAPNTLNGNYYLKNQKSGLYLEVAFSSQEAGDNIQQWRYQNGNHKQWRFQSATGDWVSIINVNSNKAMDITDWSKQKGANIQQWHDSGNTNQLFKPKRLNNGHYVFMSKHSGLCLDIAGGSSDLGANLQQWTCLENAAQQFELIKVN